MNIILVLVDSLNKSALKTYNPDTICETPYLEKFAKKSLVFDNHYISSLPCMPARREIFAGYRASRANRGFPPHVVRGDRG